MIVKNNHFKNMMLLIYVILMLSLLCNINCFYHSNQNLIQLSIHFSYY